MRIFHFILGKANKDRPNGVNQVIAGLCKYQSKNGEDVKVIGLASNASKEGEIEERDSFKVNVYSRWSNRLYKDLIEAIKWSDVVHFHGVYSFHNILVGHIVRKINVPYVVTLHNGLSPELSGIKKKIFDYIFQKKFLESAQALHVLAKEEMTDINKVCNAKKFVYAPNGVDFDDFTPKDMQINFRSNPAKQIIIGYLGRISSEKNLLNLIKAIEFLRKEIDVTFKLAGPESKHLRDILKKSSTKIEWVGPRYGEQKISFIKSLDLFVHPSKADVFSISAMEVLTLGVPLLITRSAKASYFYNSNSFFMCENSSQGILLGLKEAIEHSNEWDIKAINGQKLAKDLFNWDVTSKKLITAYNKILE